MYTSSVDSGLVIPSGAHVDMMPEVVMTSGYAYLHFYSDAAYNMSGFNISYVWVLEVHYAQTCVERSLYSRNTMSRSCTHQCKGKPINLDWMHPAFPWGSLRVQMENESAEISQE